MQIKSVGNKDSENWSFTGVLSIWILISLYVDSAFYFLIELSLPFSESGYSYLQMLILDILLLSAFPICMISVVILILPYQKIDFSRPAIIKSLEHKLLFLCTSPILYLCYKIAEQVGSLTDSLIEPGFGIFSFGLLIWIMILGWIFFSLWCWEFFFGKNMSITLRKLRTGNKNNQFGSSSNISRVSFPPDDKNRHNSLFGKVSLRYISFMCAIPILIMMLGITLDPNGGFLAKLLISIGLDLFACFFSLLFLKNYLSQQGHSLDFIKQINNHLFGDKDIDSTSFKIGFVLIAIIFLFSSIIDYFIPKGMFILIYLFLVFIFIFMVWSNQIKALFLYL